jgi:hypothetical protein
MMPSSRHRARQAIDAVFGTSDKRRTANGRPVDSADSAFDLRRTGPAVVDLDENRP